MTATSESSKVCMLKIDIFNYLEGDIIFDGLIPSRAEEDDNGEFMLSLKPGTIFSSKYSMAMLEISRSS